jgi:hypothetical protein
VDLLQVNHSNTGINTVGKAIKIVAKSI